ncbi:MAG: sodium:proton antiporter [Alphaproteobacteria bacterium]
MTTFELIALLFTITALAGYINHRLVKLPNAIGLMAMALGLSLGIVALGKIGIFETEKVRELVLHIDFSNILMHGMLSFLLFAGALHVNVSELRKVRTMVTLLATGGVVLTVLITGSIVWVTAGWLGINLSYHYALLFGALIAPTDPIAVLGILKNANVSRKLYSKIGGESLFNDGTGIIVFLTLLGVATTTQEPNFLDISFLLGREVVGGLVLGFLTGWLTNRLINSIDEYKVEVLLTLALVTGGYALAEALHVSAPIALSVAGLVVGNHGRMEGMSEMTRERLDVFWELLDEILSAILFMLMGLQMILIDMSWAAIALGTMAIFATLLGRFLSVATFINYMRLWRHHFDRGTITLMTWGGLRGGISIALALSLPPGQEKDLLLAITYIVVVFSIIVQGTTFGWAIRWATAPKRN